MQPQWNPLSWASDHWTQLSIGAALAAGLWKIHRSVAKVKSYLKGLTTAQEGIEKIKDNHLPHLQMELEKINDNLSGLREDTRGFRDDLRLLLMGSGK